MTYALLASAEINQLGQILIPPQLPQNDINTPDSGRYAAIINKEGTALWRSPSSLGENLSMLQPLQPGYAHFEPHKYEHRKPFIFRFGSVWGLPSGQDIFLTFAFVQSKTQYHRAINGYRETLVKWLGGGVLVTLLFHGLVLMRELRPLGRVVHEVEQIEKGESLSIKGDYPAELALLSQRINAFIEKERAQTDSYRHAVDDLAHSLKTPLAVIRGMDLSNTSEAKTTPHNQTPLLLEQLDRMSEIIDYQLKRAAAAGKATMQSKRTAISPILRKTVASLQKVYADKQVETTLNCEEGIDFPSDKDDLYEILGNLIDNAFKLCKTRVNVNCYRQTNKHQKSELIIEIGDDGPGIGDEIRQEITHRGVRGDQQMPGQGIGLAVVQAIVRSYGGSMSIDNSPLGGALIRLTI